MEYCTSLVCYQFAVARTDLCPRHHGSDFYPKRPVLQDDKKRRTAEREHATKVYKDNFAELQTLQRVALLKRIEEVSGEAFFKSLQVDPTELKQVARVVVESNMAGVEEGSERFFELLDHKARRMSLCRDMVDLALSDPQMATTCGFTDFERLLIIGSAHISQAYDAYFLCWEKEANHPLLLTAIESQDADTLASRDGCVHLLSPYTMALTQCRGKGFVFKCEPYSVFFESLLDPVLNAFDVCIQSLHSCTNSPQERAMVAYLHQYRHSLAESNPDHLESAWELCDRLWMDTQGSLQVVHDIEDGYSDPLRVKQCPDFSLRFLDETYHTENDVIKEIQALICKYYSSRPTRLAQAGLTALSNTLAGIYYIPFKTGSSLVFAYSGQSIPNRLQVKEEKGVKIYFDAVETQARVEQVIAKVPLLFKDGAALLAQYNPSAVEQLVWHVAAHEVGHAIYGISNMSAFLSNEVITLLEEPRAELTAMFTLRLLHQTGRLSLPDLQKHVVQFAMDGLRYFSKFSSQPMQPYIIFQIHAYNVYLKHGFFQFEQNAIIVDPSKVLDVLDDFSALFESVLASCDKQNEEGGKELEGVLATMRQVTPFVEQVVKMCS